MALNPSVAALAADAILIAHVGIVAFVVLGQLLILVGGWRGWPLVRSFALRITHLALMLFIALQAWWGASCPLTVWEQALRDRAGQSAYSESFIEHWLARLIFFEAPWWVFVAIYTGFAAWVAMSWYWIRPRSPRRWRRGTSD